MAILDSLYAQLREISTQSEPYKKLRKSNLKFVLGFLPWLVMSLIYLTSDGGDGRLSWIGFIAAFERAGFVLEGTSEINANPNDPVDGVVWRLPPPTTDNPDTQDIGVSDRMTLRFRKPT